MTAKSTANQSFLEFNGLPFRRDDFKKVEYLLSGDAAIAVKLRHPFAPAWGYDRGSSCPMLSFGQSAIALLAHCDREGKGTSILNKDVGWHSV